MSFLQNEYGDIVAFRKKFIKKFNRFHKESRETRMDVEENIRTVKAGEVPWSPEYKIYTNRIKLWRRVLKWKQGRNTSRKIMQRLANLVNLNWNNVRQVTLEQAKRNHHTARKDYYKQKKEHPKMQIAHMKSLLDALSTKNNTTADTVKKQLKREKKSRIQGMQAR